MPPLWHEPDHPSDNPSDGRRQDCRVVGGGRSVQSRAVNPLVPRIGHLNNSGFFTCSSFSAVPQADGGGDRAAESRTVHKSVRVGRIGTWLALGLTWRRDVRQAGDHEWGSSCVPILLFRDHPGCGDWLGPGARSGATACVSRTRGLSGGGGPGAWFHAAAAGCRCAGRLR